MAGDPLDQVLRLVAEGRLTAEEAAPILAALDEATAGDAARGSALPGNGSAPGAHGWATGAHGWATSGPGPAAFGAGATSASAGDSRDGDGPTGSPSSLRIEIRDNGRNVVNLRLPIAVGRFALDRVPGLSGDQVTRVREAMNAGFRGPVLVVDDGDSGVRIVLE